MDEEIQTEGDAPVYPTLSWSQCLHCGQAFQETGKTETWIGGCDGMTLRQYYAGLALAGRIRQREDSGEAWPDPAQTARHAVKLADALIAALNEK